MATRARSTGTGALRQLNRLYDEHWEFVMRESPTYATYLGDHRYDDRLEDASEEGFRRHVAQYRASLEKLRDTPIKGLAPGDRLNRDLFARALNDFLEGARFRPYLLPMTQQNGPHIDLPELVTYHPFGDARGFETFCSRLQAFPRLVEQVIANMRTGVQERIVPARVTVEKIVPQIDAQIVEPEKSDLYNPATQMPKRVRSADAHRLRGQVREAVADAVVPAYEALRAFVRDEYLSAARADAGVWSLPDGRERYRYAVRHFTTTSLLADEIHTLGLRELARVHAEIRAIMDRMGFAGSVPGFATKLRNDPTLHYATGPELLAGFREILRRMDRALPKLFGRLPKSKYGFREIEPFRADAAPDAYYYPPPEDGSRPAYFYVNTHKPEERPKYTMEALAYHEAVPGHHLQLAIQQELANLPKFRRYGGHTVFIEGWALYSEQLPKEIGFYVDPLSDFGRLTLEAWRAARLVVDTGIHEMRWSRERAIAFFEENTALSRHNIVSEVERYIANPGQALAYKIGQLKIRELRGIAERRLRARFDLRAFHDELLSDGGLPLDILERKMARWVSGRSARPRRPTRTARASRSRGRR